MLHKRIDQDKLGKYCLYTSLGSTNIQWVQWVQMIEMLLKHLQMVHNKCLVVVPPVVMVVEWEKGTVSGSQNKHRCKAEWYS